MSRLCQLTVLLGTSVLLSACGNSGELDRKLASVQQCINSPSSIQKSFELADQEGRIPVYVTSDNTGQYENTDWYQNNETIYEDMEWGLEDWSAISDLSECDQALTVIETENPKSKSVIRARNFLSFNETIFKKYNSEQLEDTSFELEFIASKAQSCLIVDSYPQAFILMNYDEEAELYPAAFSVDWDGDDFNAHTSTADGRDALWRRIKSVKETGCLDTLNALPTSYVDRAISTDDDFLLTWSEYNAYKTRFSDISTVVENYNQIVDEQHKELKDIEEKIPSMGSYAPPVIHNVSIDYFSNRDFSRLLKTCQETKQETFVNGRGETLTSPSAECSRVQSLCNMEGIEPPLDKKVCAPYIYK